MIAVEAKLGGTVIAANAKVNDTVSPAMVIMSLDTSQQAIQLIGSERQLKAGIPLAKSSEAAGNDAELTALKAVRLAQNRLQDQAPGLRKLWKTQPVCAKVVH